jgi:cytochrome c-type biogenesis protein CcmH
MKAGLITPVLTAFALAACRSEAPAPAATPAASLPSGHPPVAAQASPRGGASGAAHSGKGLSGTIRLASQLTGRHAPSDALYVIVRSARTREILAVRKEQGIEFPFAFRISGADTMTGETAFVGPFDVTVRLSKTGDALPATGDIEGTAKGVADGAAGIAITLDTVRP